MSTKQIKKNLKKVSKNKLNFVCLVSLSFIGLLPTLLVLKMTYVAYISALFSLSILVNMVFAKTIFKEKGIFYRIIGAVIMMTGAMLIVLA